MKNDTLDAEAAVRRSVIAYYESLDSVVSVQDHQRKAGQSKLNHLNLLNSLQKPGLLETHYCLPQLYPGRLKLPHLILLQYDEMLPYIPLRVLSKLPLYKAISFSALSNSPQPSKSSHTSVNSSPLSSLINQLINQSLNQGLFNNAQDAAHHRSIWFNARPGPYFYRSTNTSGTLVSSVLLHRLFGRTGVLLCILRGSGFSQRRIY